MRMKTDKPEVTQSRKPKTFVPDQDQSIVDVPESITAGERLPHVSEYSGICLEKLPIKGLRTFCYSLLILLLTLSGWEVWSVIKSAFAVHWVFACVFVLLLSVVLGLGLRVTRGYLNDHGNAEAMDGIRKQSVRLLEGRDHGHAKNFISTLNTFYGNKPQQVYLKRCLDQLPDYCDDREVIEHIDRTFLQPLDQEVLRRIANFSGQTGVAVAVSPWASVDMGLALWRSMKLVDEIAQVYGMRPSLANRYTLIKSVINQLALIGVSEIILDQTMEEIGVSTLSGIAGVRAGQAIGAGVYTAKIGVAAMIVTRPIAFSEKDRPKLKSLIAPIVINIKTMIK
ncbi:hypothetical protein A9Q81_26055 [Gammaproteobacteria bacterium 42_54_T18]|nr:hypothetical protein A9Q81_26055 [Gammaproteobacteria bacterium 42_54_T18]